MEHMVMVEVRDLNLENNTDSNQYIKAIDVKDQD